MKTFLLWVWILIYLLWDFITYTFHEHHSRALAGRRDPRSS